MPASAMCYRLPFSHTACAASHTLGKTILLLHAFSHYHAQRLLTLCSFYFELYHQPLYMQPSMQPSLFHAQHPQEAASSSLSAALLHAVRAPPQQTCACASETEPSSLFIISNLIASGQEGENRQGRKGGSLSPCLFALKHLHHALCWRAAFDTLTCISSLMVVMVDYVFFFTCARMPFHFFLPPSCCTSKLKIIRVHLLIKNRSKQHSQPSSLSLAHTAHCTFSAAACCLLLYNSSLFALLRACTP